MFGRARDFGSPSWLPVDCHILFWCSTGSAAQLAPCGGAAAPHGTGHLARPPGVARRAPRRAAAAPAVQRRHRRRHCSLGRDARGAGSCCRRQPTCRCRCSGGSAAAAGGRCRRHSCVLGHGSRGCCASSASLRNWRSAGSGRGGGGPRGGGGRPRPPPPLRLHPLAVLPGSHQLGVNALAAAWLDAGELLAAAAAASGGPSAVGVGGATTSGRVSRTAVLLSGGDDQVLRAVAIAFSLPAGTTGSGNPRQWQPKAVATQDAATVAAAPDGGGTAAAGEAAAPTGVPAAVAVGATAVVPNAHTSALRAVWTNGHRAFSTGLDQRVRCWRLAAEPGESARPDSPGAGAPPGGALGGAAGCSAGDVAAAGAAAVGGGRGGSSNGTADAGSGSGGGLAPGMRLVREGASVTQVLEPSCLAVAEAGDGDGGYVVAVAGRGMQLLKYERGRHVNHDDDHDWH